MLTLKKTADGIEIAKLYNSDNDKNPQPVFWYPKKDPSIKMGIDDVSNYIGSTDFRDYYKLSLLEARAISDALKRGKDVPDGKKGLQNKFFNVKKDLERKLYINHLRGAFRSCGFRVWLALWRGNG